MPEHVLYSRLGNEGVLLNLQTGLFFSLDTVGARAWELMLEYDTEQVIERLLQEYEVGRERLASDLEQLLRNLRENQLVNA